MKFRIVYTLNLPKELFDGLTYRTVWFDASQYTIKKLRKIEKAYNKCKRIKDWYLEYNRN